MDKYTVCKNYGNRKWNLHNLETGELSFLSSFDDVLNALKSDTGKFTVVDLDISGVAHFEEGRVVGTETETGWQQDEDYMKEQYQ